MCQSHVRTAVGLKLCRGEQSGGRGGQDYDVLEKALLAMVSNLRAMASNLMAMASRSGKLEYAGIEITPLHGHSIPS